MTTLLVNQESPTRSSNSFWKLYLFRFMGTWDNRQWWFGCGIFVFQLRPRDLTLNAILGLSMSLSQVLLGSWLGSWIDNNDRLFAVRVFLGVQNTCITVACTLVAIFFYSDSVEHNSILFAVIVIVLAVFAELGALGDKIVVERDWVVQISSSKDDLARMNTIFQTIDLGSKTMAPVFVGLLIQYTGLSITATVLSVWNICSAIVEYILLSMIFKEYPKLLSSRRVSGERTTSLLTKLRSTWHGWKLYMAHPTRNAGLSLAFLYMTVLALNSVLWAYSLLQCVKESFLSILVGIAAINGIMGSMAFPWLRKHFGVECAGEVGLISLLSALVICVISVFLPGSPWRMPSHQGEDPMTSCPVKISIYTLLIGVVLSRFGLWLSDIALTQIQQQEVEEEIRGQIGGVQGSLNSTLELLKYVLVLIFPTAAEFGYLAFASFGFILFGLLLYTSYAVPACGFLRSRRMSSFKILRSEVTPLLHNPTPSPPSIPGTLSPKALGQT